ncbi:ribonuclease HII [Novispirillum sp. DQ9]|uniref:ribonuclease HII n=1 Tax=Novispirillum sp. DQ9 TaxID=3398612 RepID=UPI003C7A0008
MPDFTLELACDGIVCGVDEAGRGPLAGPVVAGAAILDRDRLPAALIAGLDDSKKLSAAKREALFALLHGCGAARLGVGVASVEEIDRHNILRATHIAMARAVAALGVLPALALVDGNQPPRDFACAVQCVVKGDGLSLSIAAASIVAKVTRDRMMTELHALFPHYGWDRNAGYGTAEHRAAIARIGFTPHHRRSFSVKLDLFAAAERA